jgi:hypothetical protein
MAAVTAAAIVLATGAFAYWSRGGNTSAKGQTPIAERPQFAVAGSLSATGVERTPVRQAFPLFHDHRNCTDNRSAWSNHELCLDDRSARVERAVLAENPANAVAAALKRPECFHAESVSETKLSQATPSCATVTAKLYECNLPCGLQPGLNRSSYSIALEGYTTRPAQLEPHVFTRAATRERTLTIQYAKDIPSTVSPTAWKWSVQVTEMDTGRETVLTETQRSEGRLISQFNEKTRTLLLVFP